MTCSLCCLTLLRIKSRVGPLTLTLEELVWMDENSGKSPRSSSSLCEKVVLFPVQQKENIIVVLKSGYSTVPSRPLCSHSFQLLLWDQEASMSSQEQRGERTLQPNEEALFKLSHQWERLTVSGWQGLSLSDISHHITHVCISVSLIQLPAPCGHRLAQLYLQVPSVGWLGG